MRFAVLIAFAAASCQAAPEQNSDPIPHQESVPQEELLVVSGEYKELNVRKGRGEPIYARRVFILSEEGSWLLETDDLGIRPEAELEAFRGQRVEVKARIKRENCTAWGDGTAASIVMDCVQDVVSIRAEN